MKTVVLRAADAERVEVRVVPGGRLITVLGVPEGDAKGYHPADPDWRETPASAWGLDFKARPFGPTLVVSTDKEIEYIHHHYRLTRLMVAVPPGVKVVKSARELTGEGAADLSPPTGREVRADEPLTLPVGVRPVNAR